MAEKHIFIGLGGSGVNTVSLIKYKVYERTKGTEMKSRLQVMNETYRFLFVDTDDRDVYCANEKYRNLYEGGRIDFISPRELLNLGDLNPYISYREAVNHPEIKINQRILEACPEMVADSMDNRNLSFGAGALRLKSRIAFARKEKDFIEMLKTSINDLNQNEIDNEPNVIHYWVVASTNGGTGSGTVQDVLYLVNMLHRTHIDRGNPKVGLVLYMPRIYMNINAENEKYPRNAFAVFKELEAFQKWSKDATKSRIFHRMAMLDSFTLFDESLPYRPFEFCIPIDFHTDNNNNLGNINKMYSNTAELMFYIHSGQGARGFKSFLDNNEDGELANGPECFLIPMGYMAIRKPNEEFENYMALRIKYEMLRYGIIGSAIDSTEERKKLMMSLFDTVIRSSIFQSGTGTDSYFKIITEIANEMIDEEMPDNIIRNSNNKITNKLPNNVSIEDARSIISSIEAAIRRRGEDKNKTRKAIEHQLWRWTEDNARKWGLQYVRDILLELDAFCTELYMAYTTDTHTSILQNTRCNSRKSLIESRDSIERELDDLYQKALQITFKESLLKTNTNDVQAFFSRLKDWIGASVKVMLAEEAFDMLRELSYGDRGIIDHIITHVRKLLTEATSVLNGDKGVAQGYTNLAKNFYAAKLDVTSVFLPDISEFVDGYGWREDGNKFSEWYSLIIGHGSDFVEGEGYIPLRNNDPTASLEGIFSQMISLYNEKMIQEKYFVNDESHLFTNTNKTDFKRVIEDLLDYTVGTMKSLLQQNETICKQWYEKTLADFFSELNNEARREIQQKTQPSVFFPYNKAQRASRITDKAFCVGPNGVVNDVFIEASSAGKTAFYDSTDPSVMYKLVTKLGMSFDYYDMYHSIKNEYDACINKVFYHFHQAFAHAGGNADNIKLPRELRPELIVFTKYLILNQLSSTFSHIMRKGDADYNAGFYTDSPIIFTDMLAKFATSGALSMIDNEKIELKITDGDAIYYHTVAINRPEHKMTELVRGFSGYFANGRFASLVTELVRYINFLEPDLLGQKYQSAISTLKAELNTQWKAAGKQEQETIGDILRVLNDKLDTISKFLSNRYIG